jgi:CRP-like cAMP-binding protein
MNSADINDHLPSSSQSRLSGGILCDASARRGISRNAWILNNHETSSGSTSLLLRPRTGSHARSRSDLSLAGFITNIAETDDLLVSPFKSSRREPIVGKFSQETLAEMIGTTRSRVSFFMNKFRKLGFIEYNGKLEVHNSC